jgi:hypothetical protein
MDCCRAVCFLVPRSYNKMGFVSGDSRFASLPGLERAKPGFVE